MPDTAVVWSDAEVVLTLGPNEAEDGDIRKIVMSEVFRSGQSVVFIGAIRDIAGGNSGALAEFIGTRGSDFATLTIGTSNFLQDYEFILSEFHQTDFGFANIAFDYDAANRSGTNDLLLKNRFSIRDEISGDEATNLDVAWDGTNYLATWEENDGSGGRRYDMALFDASGNRIDNAQGGSGTTSGAVAVNENGQFIAVAIDNNIGQLRYRDVNPADGAGAMSFNQNVTVLGGSDATISDVEMVSLTDGNFVATYATAVTTGFFPNSTTTYRIEQIIIDPDGNLVSGPTQLALTSSSGFSFASVTSPTVEALSSGGYIVAYDSNAFLNDSIAIQRYDNAGNAVGQTLFLSGTTSSSFESEIELLELSDGRIQVAWRETEGDVERLVTQIIDYRDSVSFNAGGDLIGTAGNDEASISGERSALMGQGDDGLTYNATDVDEFTQNLVMDGGDGIDTLILRSVNGVRYDADTSPGDIPMYFDNMGSSVQVGIIQGFENFTLGSGDDFFNGQSATPLIDERPVLDAGRGDDDVRFFRVDATDLGVIVTGGIGDDQIQGDLGQDDILYGGSASDTGRVIEATSTFGFAFNTDNNNTSLTTAISLDNSFSLFFNGNIDNAASNPHATAFGFADGSGMHVYRFNVEISGTVVSLDIDAGLTQGSGSQDLSLSLFDSEGNLVAFNRDGGGLDAGSQSDFDPFLVTGPLGAGLYYVVVHDDTTIASETASDLFSSTSEYLADGTTYALNVSVDQGVSDDDTINGLGGNDYIEGGRGADTLDGGDDIDTLGYRQSDAGVIVLLQFDTAAGGHATGDIISNFENVDGSNFDDEITGDDDPNVLRGFSGDDEIDGLGGDDVIDGGLGADVIDGGMGTNTVSFATSDETGVTVLLHTGMGTAGHATGDTYANIQNVTGSDFNDFIQGDGNANVLDGGDGNDTLVGRGGADELIGGEGFDTASYFDQAAGVTASLFTGMGAGGDTFTSIERLVGSNFNDVLIGRDGASDTLEGGMGNDTLRGNGGDDTMLGGDGVDLFFSGFGADSHDGGAGTDTVTYNLASAGVIVRLDIGQGFFNQADGDTYTNIENLVGSAFRDALTGTAVANRLEGRAGNDDLFGLAGSDTLLGGNGSDKLDGGTGFDVLTGGLGMDTFVFQAGYQADRITDFTNGDDVLDLTSFGFTSFSQVSALASQQGNDTVINFGNGDAIRLVDFDVADFDANDVMI